MSENTSYGLEQELLLEGALERHLVTKREDYRASRSTARDAYYATLADRAELAGLILKNTDLRRAFVNMDLWRYERDRPGVDDQIDVLHFVLRVMEGGGDAATKRISKQSIAINGLQQEGIRPSDFLAEFKRRGGFAAVVASFAKEADEAVSSRAKSITLHVPHDVLKPSTAMLCLVTMVDAGGETRRKASITVIGAVPDSVPHAEIMQRLMASPFAPEAAKTVSQSSLSHAGRSQSAPNRRSM